MLNAISLISCFLTTLPCTVSIHLALPFLADPTPVLQPRDYPVISVSVAQPSICTTSELQFSTVTAIPTGQFQVIDDQTVGWGNTGSIWNFTLDDGVTFDSLSAQCQGSPCTGITGNKEGNGQILIPSDSTWQMNVSDGMSPSINVMGVTKGGEPQDGEFHLTITSTPPCALPIAQNCTNKHFDPTAQQWEAYSVAKWLQNYTDVKKTASLGELYNNLANDFLDVTTKDDMNCEPESQDYTCDPPDGADLQLDCDSDYAAAGLLAIRAVIHVSNVLHFLYSVFGDVEAEVTNWVEQLVDTFVKPTVQAKWEAIATAASSIVGLLVFFFILADALTEGSATTVGVAVIVGITNSIGAAANFANGFKTQAPDDTYLNMTGQYRQSLTEYTDYMRNSTSQLWAPDDPTKFGVQAVNDVFGDGSWVSIANPLNVTGLDLTVQHFFETLVVASLINRSWKSNNFYIQFIPYGTVTDFEYNNAHSPVTTNFDHDQCANHWANDPRRPNYISCDLTYGGKPGMTVLAQPAKEDSGTLALVKGVAFSEPLINYDFQIDHVLQSSLDGNAQHGFNYNLTTDQFDTLVDKGGARVASEFSAVSPAAAGLYNLDVCVITQLSYIGGAQQYGKSNHQGPSLTNFIWIYLDPCVCSGFSSHGGKFTDSVSSEIADAVTTTTNSYTQDCMSRGWPANAGDG